jgi:hypothetical protein
VGDANRLTGASRRTEAPGPYLRQHAFIVVGDPRRGQARRFDATAIIDHQLDAGRAAARRRKWRRPLTMRGGSTASAIRASPTTVTRSSSTSDARGGTTGSAFPASATLATRFSFTGDARCGRYSRTGDAGCGRRTCGARPRSRRIASTGFGGADTRVAAIGGTTSCRATAAGDAACTLLTCSNSPASVAPRHCASSAAATPISSQR